MISTLTDIVLSPPGLLKASLSQIKPISNDSDTIYFPLHSVQPLQAAKSAKGLCFCEPAPSGIDNDISCLSPAFEGVLNPIDNFFALRPWLNHLKLAKNPIN